MQPCLAMGSLSSEESELRETHKHDPLAAVASPTADLAFIQQPDQHRLSFPCLCATVITGAADKDVLAICKWSPAQKRSDMHCKCKHKVSAQQEHQQQLHLCLVSTLVVNCLQAGLS